jgi:hypothetical protein
MEKVLALLAAVIMILGFSLTGFAFQQNVIGYAYYPNSMLGTVETGHQANVALRSTCPPGEAYTGVSRAYTGVISWVNRDTNDIMVRGQDGNRIFNVSGAHMKGIPEKNQLVTVNYTMKNGDRIASSVASFPKSEGWLYAFNF